MDPIISVHENMKDMIWIHDTYLMLLPKLARRTYINGCIGFSMHSPFPSSDIYKMFEHRKVILKSLLCCDLIGFHIFEYARHFYTACNRLLGLNHEFKQGGQLGIEFFGRTVMLRISHIAVDINDINNDLQMISQESKKGDFSDKLRAMIGDRSEVFSSIDRSHLISGFRNKLYAYKKFLLEYPRTSQMCCLVQYLIPFDCLACEDPDCLHYANSEFNREVQKLINEI